jgi:hypothetical protein
MERASGGYLTAPNRSSSDESSEPAGGGLLTGAGAGAGAGVGAVRMGGAFGSFLTAGGAVAAAAAAAGSAPRGRPLADGAGESRARFVGDARVSVSSSLSLARHSMTASRLLPLTTCVCVCAAHAADWFVDIIDGLSTSDFTFVLPMPTAVAGGPEVGLSRRDDAAALAAPAPPPPPIVSSPASLLSPPPSE